MTTEPKGARGLDALVLLGVIVRSLLFSVLPSFVLEGPCQSLHSQSNCWPENQLDFRALEHVGTELNNSKMSTGQPLVLILLA